MEQYTRSKDKIEGSILSLYPPAIKVTKFIVILNPDGLIQNFQSTAFYPGRDAKNQILTQRNAYIEKDSVRQTFFTNGVFDSLPSKTFRSGLGAIPSLDNDVALYEQMLQQLLLLGMDSVSIARFTSGASRNFIKKISENRYETRFFFYPILISTNTSKEIETLDATGTTVKTVATMTQPFDFEMLVAKYVARQKEVQPSRSLSPSDSITMSINDVEIKISYGRPLKRGRTIFGEVVPWNQVWRLGADYATHFTTTKELQFETFTLPKGRYTLWLLPSLNEPVLIINKRINIGGTLYDPKQDLIHFRMSSRRLATIVEKLTINIKKTLDGGMLVIQWDDMEFSLPFSSVK